MSLLRPAVIKQQTQAQSTQQSSCKTQNIHATTIQFENSVKTANTDGCHNSASKQEPIPMG